MTVELGEVVRIDHEVEDRAWLLERFSEMAQDIVTTWDVAQDIAANWTEGRKVSELPECEGKSIGQVFADWVDVTTIDRRDIATLRQMLKAARIKRIAPSEYQDHKWSLYGQLPADADAARVADIFRRAEAQPVGITQRSLQLVMGRASGMKPPYWQQVISALTTGEHGLTPSTARNIIATATKWLKDNPDAPTRA